MVVVVVVSVVLVLLLLLLHAWRASIDSWCGFCLTLKHNKRSLILSEEGRRLKKRANKGKSKSTKLSTCGLKCELGSRRLVFALT